MLPNPNGHVKSFLDYYLDASNELDYAVLIDGRWGSGKTYLVKQYLREANLKHFFVSLNGITTVRQVEEEFYRQRHPVLASKGMRVAGAVLRGAIKATLKVDLDSDGKEDASVSAQLPDIDIVKELGNPREYLLVFDDLERASLPAATILGYINAFVEQDGMRAIVLANEDEITKSDPAYRRIKEKLFGQTLRVTADADAGFDNFVGELSDKRIRTLLISNKELIVTLHRESGTENLRLLKHAIWDFARVASALSEQHWSKKSAVIDLLKVLLPLSFEVRSGRVNRNDVSSVIGMDYAKYFKRHESETKTVDQEVEERYPNAPFQTVILGPERLERLLFDGWVEPDEIRADLNQSPTFGDSQTVPIWRRAWDSYELPDDEFSTIIHELESQFAARAVTDIGPLLHLFSIRLHLADIGAIDETRRQVVASCKRYLDDLLKNEQLEPYLEQTVDTTGYAGLGFHERDSSEFKEIVAYFESRAGEATARALPAASTELLERLDTDPDEFLFDVAHNRARVARFARLPVLAFIEPEAFVRKVLSVDPSAQSKALRALKARYEMGSLQSDLKAELPWLRKVRVALSSAAKEAQPNTRGRLNSLIRHAIDPMIATVSTSKKKKKNAQARQDGEESA